MAKRHKPRRKAIRFGIGAPERGLLSIWRVWTHGREAYLTIRSGGQAMKASLHSSGRWQFLLSDKQGVIGKRPSAQILPGLTRGPGVIYPGGFVQSPLQGIPYEDPSPITWYPDPLPHRKRSFTLMFADPSLSKEEVLLKLGAEVDLLGPLPLEDHEKLWVAALDEPMADNEEAIMRDTKDKVAIHVKANPTSVSDAYAYAVHKSPGEELVFVAIALGEENISLEATAE